MRPATAAFALLALLVQSANASADDMTLTLPHPLVAGEIAWLQLQVGPIGRGQEIEVTTAAGQELGTISSFGVGGGQEAGAYTLPMPADAIRDGRLAVRLTISQSGAPPRAPTAQEVRSVKLIAPGAPR